MFSRFFYFMINDNSKKMFLQFLPPQKINLYAVCLFSTLKMFISLYFLEEYTSYPIICSFPTVSNEMNEKYFWFLLQSIPNTVWEVTFISFSKKI